MSPYQMAWTPPKPCNLSRRSIYLLARRCAEEMGFNPGDNIQNILKRLGGTLETAHSLDRCGSTMIVLGEQNFIASVPPHSNAIHDRFRLAEHIAHYLLHYLWYKRENPDSGLIRIPQYLTDRTKWEAVWFISEFLMPEDQFGRDFRTCRGSIPDLASIYLVSPAIARTRSQGLGLLTTN